MLNLLVGIQVATMAGLAVLFWRSGDHRLATAQFMYCVATVALFTK